MFLAQYDVPVNVLGGGTPNGLALTLDAKSQLVVYLIKGSSIFAAYQSGDAFVVEDTGFRELTILLCHILG